MANQRDRVVARYKMAALPSTFWSEQGAALARILKKPIHENGFVHELNATLIPFVSSLEDALEAEARKDGVVKHLLGKMLENLLDLQDGVFSLNKTCESMTSFGSSPHDAIQRLVAFEILEAYRGAFKTVHQATKTVWSVDAADIAALAAKLNAQTTAEEQAALVEKRPSPASLDVKFEFLERVKLEALARRLIKKTAPARSILDWFSLLKLRVQSNLTSEG